MKKHLVAILSMLGLAGAAGPARPQVLKGSDQTSKAENQLKQDKQTQEKNAVQKVRGFKSSKGASAGKALKRGLTAKASKQSQEIVKVTDKSLKAQTEQKAAQFTQQKKGVKNKAGVKGESQDQ